MARAGYRGHGDNSRFVVILPLSTHTHVQLPNKHFRLIYRHSVSFIEKMKASTGLILSQWSCKLRGRRYRNIIGQLIMALNVSKKTLCGESRTRARAFCKSGGLGIAWKISQERIFALIVLNSFRPSSLNMSNEFSIVEYICFMKEKKIKQQEIISKWTSGATYKENPAAKTHLSARSLVYVMSSDIFLLEFPSGAQGQMAEKKQDYNFVIASGEVNFPRWSKS